MAQAITLVESTRRADLQRSQQLLQSLMPYTGNSIRIGITGVPGVGKSTFIEAIGKHLTDNGHKLAVLAVDPSSPYTGGSILGDKTRMQDLSRMNQVFIRPSPTGGTLGGVSRKTRESILLCEAAGYDIILVETVGVGQSEYEVASMVDFFLMLMLPNAGDSLQGIKRGIMELADFILVNKADGEFLKKAKSAAGEYQNALKLVRPKYREPSCEIQLCSALSGNGIPEAWEHITGYIQQLKKIGIFDHNRRQQLIHWTRRLTEDLLLSEFWEDERVSKHWQQTLADLENDKTTPLLAGKSLLGTFKKG